MLNRLKMGKGGEEGGEDSLPELEPEGGAVINKLATCFGVNYRE